MGTTLRSLLYSTQIGRAKKDREQAPILKGEPNRLESEQWVRFCPFKKKKNCQHFNEQSLKN